MSTFRKGEQCLALVLLLLISAPTFCSETDSLALLFAYSLKGDLEKVKELTTTTASKKGIDVNTKDKRFGTTALHAAATGGHIGVIKYLIKKGADFHIKDNEGNSPLNLAPPNEAAWKYLKNELHREKVAAMPRPARKPKFTYVHVDINTRDRKVLTKLHRAVKAGDLAEVKRLIKSGADIDKTNLIRVTPLHMAIIEGHDEIAIHLIKSLADLEKRNMNGQTALHLAAMFGRLPVVKALAGSGAKLNVKCNRKYTPLRLAKLERKLETVIFLERFGAKDY